MIPTNNTTPVLPPVPGQQQMQNMWSQMPQQPQGQQLGWLGGAPQQPPQLGLHRPNNPGFMQRPQPPQGGGFLGGLIGGNQGNYQMQPYMPRPQQPAFGPAAGGTPVQSSQIPAMRQQMLNRGGPAAPNAPQFNADAMRQMATKAKSKTQPVKPSLGYMGGR